MFYQYTNLSFQKLNHNLKMVLLMNQVVVLLSQS
mgnify:CR=1 FL=1